jgi:hypothetical protein
MLLHAINMIETEPTNNANATFSSRPTASLKAHQPARIETAATAGPVQERPRAGAEGNCGLWILQSEGLPARTLTAARTVSRVVAGTWRDYLRGCGPQVFTGSSGVP